MSSSSKRTISKRSMEPNSKSHFQTSGGTAAPITKQKKTSGFLMDLRYRNDLPLPPIDPKHIKIPGNPEKLISYHRTTLERNYMYRLHMEPTIGSSIQLIDPGSAENKEVKQLTAADKHLIRREADDITDYYSKVQGGVLPDESGVKISTFASPMSLRNITDSSKVRAGKHWLRKTEYIDNKLMDLTQKTISGLYENERRAKEVEKENRLIEGNIGRLSKTERIELSFKAVNMTPVHQTRKDLRPVKIFSVVPNLDMARNQLFNVQFMDENLLNEVGNESDKFIMQKGLSIVNYTPAEVATLQDNILEQIDPNDEGKISLFLRVSDGDKSFEVSKVEPNKDVNESKVSGDGSESKGSDSQPDKAEKSESPRKDNFATNDDESQDNSGGESARKYLRWTRDYQYTSRKTNRCEKFAMAWDTEKLKAPNDIDTTVYGTVRFCELEPIRLEMIRNQTGTFDIEELRRKRIRLIHRDYTAEETADIEARLEEIKSGSMIDEEEGEGSELSTDEEVPPPPPKKVGFHLNNDSMSEGDNVSPESTDQEEEYGGNKKTVLRDSD